MGTHTDSFAHTVAVAAAALAAVVAANTEEDRVVLHMGLVGGVETGGGTAVDRTEAAAAVAAVAVVAAG